MKCPECGEEIDRATYTEATGGWVNLKQSGDKTIVESWEEDSDDKETYFYCPNCGEDITSEILVQ